MSQRCGGQYFIPRWDQSPNPQLLHTPTCAPRPARVTLRVREQSHDRDDFFAHFEGACCSLFSRFQTLIRSLWALSPTKKLRWIWGGWKEAKGENIGDSEAGLRGTVRSSNGWGWRAWVGSLAGVIKLSNCSSNPPTHGNRLLSSLWIMISRQNWCNKVKFLSLVCKLLNWVTMSSTAITSQHQWILPTSWSASQPRQKSSGNVTIISCQWEVLRNILRYTRP